MEPQAILFLLGSLLAASVTTNVLLLVRIRKRPERPQSVELQEFLVDLMQGKMGMIAVARVNQDDLLLRSPKR